MMRIGLKVNVQRLADKVKPRNVSHRAAARESLSLACFRSTYCGGVKARFRSGRRHSVSATKMTGETERGSDAVAKSPVDLLTR